MKYRVKGTINTGEEVEIDVTATSDFEARAIASKLKLLAKSVEAIIQPQAKIVAACQACGVIIPSQGILRVLGDQCFCRDCFGKRMAALDNRPVRMTQHELQSLGILFNYDKFNDVTTVVAHRSEGPERTTWWNASLSELKIGVAFPGMVQVEAVEAVQMSMEFFTDKGEPDLFPKRLQTDLKLMLDGERVSVAIDEWLKRSDIDMKYQQVNFTVKQPLLSALRFATNIQGKLVNQTMDLTKAITGGLNAMARVVVFKDNGSLR